MRFSSGNIIGGTKTRVSGNRPWRSLLSSIERRYPGLSTQSPGTTEWVFRAPKDRVRKRGDSAQITLTSSFDYEWKQRRENDTQYRWEYEAHILRAFRRAAHHSDQIYHRRTTSLSGWPWLGTLERHAGS